MTRPLKQQVRLYHLDWAGMETKKEERARESYERRPNPTSEPFLYPPTIPSSYVARMASITFAIPDTYMKAINHCCRQAMIEWEHPYPFDTCIRDHCYIPSKAFIQSAIHLLSDCIYDADAHYFNRDWETKVVFEQPALLRFWRYQMGTWAAFEAAGLKIMHPMTQPELKNTMYEMPPMMPEDCRTRIMEKDMLDFHKSLIVHQPVGPFMIEGKKCHLDGGPWNTLAAKQGAKAKKLRK
jgi:hypothetical protein